MTSAKRYWRPLRSLNQKLLPIGVSNGYTPIMQKDSGLRIRVERELRDHFLEVCRLEDRPAAQVIREFMRKYVAEHKSHGAANLFPAETTTKNR